MEADVNKIRDQVKKLSVKAGVPEEKVNQLYDKFVENLKARGMAEEKIEQNALMRIQASLKKKIGAQVNTETTPGYILSRGRAYDGSKKPRNEAKAYIAEHGMSKAVEAGYANAEGKLLYKDFNWRMGQVIPDEDWKSNGLAMLERNKTIKLANVNFKGQGALGEIELFKIADLPVYVREDGDKSMDVTISSVPDEFADEYVDFNTYADKVRKAAPKNILSSLKDVEDWYLEHGKEFGSWCIVEGNIVKISTTTKTQSTVIEIDDPSLLLEDDMDAKMTMTIFFPKETKIDVVEGAIGATFIVSPYENDKGEIILSGLGYWADPIDRVDLEEGAMIPDPTEDNWG